MFCFSLLCVHSQCRTSSSQYDNTWGFIREKAQFIDINKLSLSLCGSWLYTFKSREDEGRKEKIENWLTIEQHPKLTRVRKGEKQMSPFTQDNWPVRRETDRKRYIQLERLSLPSHGVASPSLSYFEFRHKRQLSSIRFSHLSLIRRRIGKLRFPTVFSSLLLNVINIIFVCVFLSTHLVLSRKHFIREIRDGTRVFPDTVDRCVFAFCVFFFDWIIYQARVTDKHNS